MSIEADVLAGRAEAEAIMFESCVAGLIGPAVTDDDGNVTNPITPVYVGVCKVQTTVAQAASPVSVGHKFTVENLQLHFPIGTPILTGFTVQITASRMDPSLVGLVFRIVEKARGSFRTAARWNVELVTA